MKRSCNTHGETRNSHKVLLTNVKGKGYFEDVELDRRKY
jgi:hypothetical protein